MLPYPHQNLGARYPGIFIEPFAGGAGTSITIVNGLSHGGILVERDPHVAAFWRDAIESYETSKKVAGFLEMRKKAGQPVNNLEQDPAFWAYINSHNPLGRDLTESLPGHLTAHHEMENLIELLKQIGVVFGQIRVLEGDALEILNHHPENAMAAAVVSTPYVESGRFRYKSWWGEPSIMVDILAGWKGRWHYSYDREFGEIHIVFLRPVLRKDCSEVP